MLSFFRVYYIGVLLIMAGLLYWASSYEPVWQVSEPTRSHPWFITTVFDAYFALLTIYFWAFYREKSWLSRMFWFFMIVGLGNPGVALYILFLMSKIPSTLVGKERLKWILLGEGSAS